MNNMLETVDALLGTVQIMENRPLSSHIEVVGIEPLWPLVSRKGVMHSTTKRIVEIAFDHGGFIAGGFGRWAATSNRSAMERGEYVACGGDIDLFFGSRDGWAEFLRTIGREDDLLSSMGTSQGNLAVNFVPRTRREEHTYNAPPPMQAVGCATGTPAQILRSFDFVNCMFAITRDGSCAAQEALDLEEERVLGVSSWSSRGLVHRLSKYNNKYGYQRCRDMSDGRRLDHLCDAVGRIADERNALRVAQSWASFLAHTHESFFEDASVVSDLLTCGVLPFDDAGQMTTYVMSQIPKQSTERPIGSYKVGLNSLLAREEKAKKLNEEEYNQVLAYLKDVDDGLFDDENMRYSKFHTLREARTPPDPPTWTAEQYCWSF